MCWITFYANSLHTIYYVWSFLSLWVRFPYVLNKSLRNLIMYYVTLYVYITIVQYATLDGAMHQKIITLYASISGASRQRNALRWGSSNIPGGGVKFNPAWEGFWISLLLPPAMFVGLLNTLKWFFGSKSQKSTVFTYFPLCPSGVPGHYEVNKCCVCCLKRQHMLPKISDVVKEGLSSL